MTTQTGVNLITYQVTPLQAAFLEWCKKHPYARIIELKLHEGIPLEAQVSVSFGVETVRFDRIAREEGLIPK
jgi:hypothetical protein